jgi:lysophospholipase L1-like esterase
MGKEMKKDRDARIKRTINTSSDSSHRQDITPEQNHTAAHLPGPSESSKPNWNRLPRTIDHVHKFNFYKWLKFLIEPNDLDSISSIYGVGRSELERIEQQFAGNVQALSQELASRHQPKTTAGQQPGTVLKAQTDLIDILAIGDSLTSDRESYVAILRRFWEGNHRYTIKDSAVSGDTTAQVIARYYLFVANETFNWAVLFIGTNDCGMSDDTQKLPKVSFEEYKRNLNYLTSKLQEQCGNNIIQVTLPPVDNLRLQEFVKPNRLIYDSAYIDMVNGYIRNSAVENGFYLADLASALEREKIDFLREDGIHLNDHGQLILSELILQTLT